MKKRMANIECLRCIAMMMVVLLHYLSKGEFLSPLTGPLQTNHYIAWFMEAFAIVAVNVYVLISGYFLVEAQFKVGKLVKLYLQTLFYCILIPVILVIVSLNLPEGEKLLSVSDLGIYKMLLYCLPFQMEHYWFLTAYVIMYLFAPFLAMGAKNLKKEDLQKVIICLLIFFAGMKSVVPAKLQIDRLGYDGLWFMCVFLVAAYIRLYGIPFFKSAGKAFGCFVLSSLLTFGCTFVLHEICISTGKLEDFVQTAYSYNHVLNLIGAVSLFYTFYLLKMDGEKFFPKLWTKIGPYTLGVYLLHEHIEVRWLWPKWLGANIEDQPLVLVVKALGSVLIVFTLGILVDMLRGKMFSIFEKKKN